jgi:hypothetical protein
MIRWEATRVASLLGKLLTTTGFPEETLVGRLRKLVTVSLYGDAKCKTL